jgi:methionine-rich copper-binding protein CopC
VRNVVLRVALLSLVLLFAGSGPASAHASLVGSDPEDGATLTTPPSAITLTFNENIANPAYVSVTAPNGSKVDVTDVQAVDNRITGTVADVDQKGRYTAAYRVVSADGHPVEGTIHYSTTSGRTVKQVEPADEETFIHRHSAHLFWGILAAAVAIALLLAPLRRRDDKNDA